MTGEKIPSSFRDPSGFLFRKNGSIYRQINISYRENYDHLMRSGLYRTLVHSGLLVPHEEADIALAKSDDAYKIIKPEPIKFISYPYEWCFSQLKDAALATLTIQKIALDFQMSLKDASAYNIQFRKGKPVLIDTLSFEMYREGAPWVAYKQFCQHFLAPLTLMSYSDIRLNQLFSVNIDGVPIDLASCILPFRTYLKLPVLLHIHLHTWSQRHYARKSLTREVLRWRFSLQSFRGLISSLEKAVRDLKWQPKGTEWADYYMHTNYSSEATEHKKQIIEQFLERITPKVLWDLGANTGKFSRLASGKGIETICFDNDPAAVESNYLECVQKGETNILPLLVDLTNPSPAFGWEYRERLSLIERGPSDAVLAIALVHHLAISNNLPLAKIADFFNTACNFLIIEFVPKHDSQVQRLLSTREDIFPDYTQRGFEREFSRHFTVESSVKIKDSHRILYLLERRGHLD